MLKNALILVFATIFYCCLGLPVRAQSSHVSLSLTSHSPNNSTTDLRDVILQIESRRGATGISGIDLCLSYDPTLTVVDVLDPVERSTTPEAKFIQMRKDIDVAGKRLCLTHLYLRPAPQLPRSIAITIRVSGQGNFYLQSAQIVGNIFDYEYTVDSSLPSHSIASVKEKHSSQPEEPKRSITIDNELREKTTPTLVKKQPDQPEQSYSSEPKTLLGRLLKYLTDFFAKIKGALGL